MIIKYILDGKSKYEKKIDKKEEFIITKNHSLDYEDHSYQKYKQIMLDLEQINKKDLIQKLQNYNYLNTSLNAYVIKNNARCTSSIMLLNIFKETLEI